MQSNILMAEGITFNYPASTGLSALKVLNNVSLNVAEGEWLAIMGPSGSGKTTLLNCLSGLLKPQQGRVILAGREISTMTEKQLAGLRSTSLGFIYQNFNNIKALTAWQNVSLSLVASGKSRSLDRKGAIVALREVGLEKEADKLPDQLSGGQQQRIAIARVLYQNPSLVFADEPTGALDRRSGKVVMEQLALLREKGCAIVMVTHDPWIAAFADSVLFIRDGNFAGKLDNSSPEEISQCLAYLEQEV